MIGAFSDAVSCSAPRFFSVRSWNIIYHPPLCSDFYPVLRVLFEPSRRWTVVQRGLMQPPSARLKALLAPRSTDSLHVSEQGRPWQKRSRRFCRRYEVTQYVTSLSIHVEICLQSNAKAMP